MSNFKIFKYLARYKQNSIFITNFITVLCIVLFIVSLITFSWYYYYSGLVTDAVEEANGHSMERSCATLDMFMSDCDGIFINLCNNPDVVSFMTNKMPAKNDYQRVEIISQLRTALSSMVSFNDYIISVDIYSLKNDFVISSSNDFNLMNQHSDFIKEFMIDTDNTAVVSRNFTLGSDSGRSLSIYRKAPLIDSVKRGVVMITVDEKMFSELLTGDTLRDESCFVVVDSDKRIIVSDNSDYIGTYYDSEHFAQELEGFENAVVTSVASEYNGWNYILYTKPDKYYSERNEKLYVTLFISLSVSIIAGLIAAFWITYRAYRPIAMLSDVVSSVSNDAVDTEYLINRKPDELLEIITAVFDNYKKRCEYQSKLAEKRIMMEKAQLIALQAQINPHFLYNTLENINWSVMELTGGDNSASEMIRCLSGCMRMILDTENRITTVAYELEHVRLYTKILTLRHKDEFDVIFDIDKNIENSPMVKLTLQPLVENAVYHGVLNEDGRGKITLKGYEDTDCNIIEIINTGNPLSDEELEKLNTSLDDENISESTKIGVRNVERRMKICFGKQYGLKFIRDEADNTIVKIKVPKSYDFDSEDIKK